jgi:hypothetical protein
VSIVYSDDVRDEFGPWESIQRTERRKRMVRFPGCSLLPGSGEGRGCTKQYLASTRSAPAPASRNTAAPFRGCDGWISGGSTVHYRSSSLGLWDRIWRRGMSVRQSPSSINGTLEKILDEERVLQLQKTKEGETLSPPVSKGWPARANAYSQVKARGPCSQTIA